MADDSMSTREAGQKGGKRTAQTHGSDFYQEIGHKGGEAQGKQNNPGNFANDRDKASRAGKKGGES